MSGNDILIVDSDPWAVDVITRSLNGSGYNITTIDRGEAAIHMIGDFDYDLILSELVVGESFNGLEILHRAKEVSPYNGVIIMTDQPEMISTQDLMVLDVDAFLFKPVDPEKILTCVNHCIKQSDIKRAGHDRRIEDRRKINGNGLIDISSDRRIEDRRKVCF